ncbi:MAG: efflux RND transporter periplasmic adaptor subunit [Planctomycetes bacterium]|nr:efflux RND transporter periplasmic adaptor subunit [Planctomycetota bacterium]
MLQDSQKDSHPVPLNPALLRIAGKQKQPSRGWPLALILTVFLAVTGLAFLSFLTGDGSEEKQRVEKDPSRWPAGTPTSEQGNDSNASRSDPEGLVLTVSGYIVARVRVEVSPRFMGTVKWIGVRKGDSVEEGQVLVKLEDEEYQGRLQESRGLLEAAQARLKELRAGARMEEKGQARARVQQAEARQTSLQARLRELRSGARPEEKEQARWRVSQAEGRLQAVRARWQELKSGARPEEVQAAEARVALGEANARNAEANLARFEALSAKKIETEQGRDEMRRQRDVSAAELEVARNALGLLRAGTRSEQIEQAEGEVKAAEAEVEAARQGLALVLSGPRREQLEQAEAEVISASSELSAAREAEALVLAGPRPEQIEQAEAEVRSLEGAVQVAATHLQWTVIRSPVRGIILEKLVDGGELVVPQSFGGPRGPSTALVSIADLSDLQVEIDLSEADTSKVHVGQRCRISPEAYPTKYYGGSVTEVAPEADRQKGTLEVKVKIIDPDEYLTPELTARVDFLKSVRE